MAEIEALKQVRDGADRFTVQGKLMPYEHLMPKALRGRNERLGETIPERESLASYEQDEVPQLKRLGTHSRE